MPDHVWYFEKHSLEKCEIQGGSYATNYSFRQGIKNMSKKRKSGGTTTLGVIIRALIVLIFIASLIIAFNRITEAIHNDEKKQELEKKAVEYSPQPPVWENI